MSSHNPGLMVVLIAWKHLIESSSCFKILTLSNPDPCFGVQILRRVQILNVFQSSISCREQIVLQQEIDQFEEDLVTVIGLHLLILCDHVLVVDDVHLVLYGLGSEVLWRVILWLQLVEFSHSLHLGDGEVLPGEPWSTDGLVHEAHEQVGLDVLPVFLEYGVQISMCLLVLPVLEVHRSHDQVQSRVQTHDPDILMHQKLRLLRLAVRQTELHVFKPLLRVLLLVWVIHKPLFEKNIYLLQSPQVKYIPLSVLVVSDEVVLITQSVEFSALGFLEMSVELSLLLLLACSLCRNEVIMHAWVLFDLVIDGHIQDDLHLFLKESVELSLELLLLLL